MSIKVIFFGILEDKTGKNEITLESCLDTDSLKEKLMFDYPELKKSTFLISVNKILVKKNQKLEAGNEVALLPPFAGG